jgi:hypothetical protein
MVYFSCMNAKYLVKGIKWLVLCALAVKANYYLNGIVRALDLPLFMDTFFTCVITFAGGLVPGITVAALTALDFVIRDAGALPFLLCSLAEVLLISFLKPGKTAGLPSESAPLAGGGTGGGGGRAFLPENVIPLFISTFAPLLFLYVAACLVVSVLGGIIDFVFYDVLAENKSFFSPEDTFKIGLLRDASSLLLANILSRIPINIVDRFIVIFGGFSLSLLLKKIAALWKGWGPNAKFG